MNAYRYMSLCMYTDIYIHHVYIEIHTNYFSVLVEIFTENYTYKMTNYNNFL